MKKFAFFVAVALCLTLCLMIPASAEESAEEPALESEGFRWRLLEDGDPEVYRRGAAPDPSGNPGRPPRHIDR